MAADGLSIHRARAFLRILVRLLLSVFVLTTRLVRRQRSDAYGSVDAASEGAGPSPDRTDCSASVIAKPPNLDLSCTGYRRSSSENHTCASPPSANMPFVRIVGATTTAE